MNTIELIVKEYVTCEDLEKAIDRGDDVLEMLESICYEKAEHVRSCWQDEDLAERWELAAEKLRTVRFPM